MAPSSFTENLIHSSQGRLPGSNMNESHHIMPGLFHSEDHDVDQNNQVNQTGDSSQEAQRSVVGQQPENDYQRIQSSALDATKPDNLTRPKQQQQPHQHLDYDPDPATKSAFQNVSKPIPTRQGSAGSEEHTSAANSLDSNRAIINEPFVSGQPSDSAPYESMPATYRQDFHQDQSAGWKNQGAQGNQVNRQANVPTMNQRGTQGNQVNSQANVAPLNKQDDQMKPQAGVAGMNQHPQFGVSGMNQHPQSGVAGMNQYPQNQYRQSGEAGMNQHPQSDVDDSNQRSRSGVTGTDKPDLHHATAAGMNERGPLDTTGMTQPQRMSGNPDMVNHQPNAPLTDNMHGQPNGLDSGRRRSSLTKRRGSTPDSECMAALPVMQSYVPYAQGVAIMRNHEARYEDDQQQAAATNRRYSLHGADEPSQPSDRRRSSLTETIGKIFHRRGSK